MSDSRYDVVGIGNAIVDVIARCDDAFLSKHSLHKGHMRLITAGEADTLYSQMGQGRETSGGSVANSCAGLASFGASAAFIGRVADDQLGRIFSHDISSIGVAYNTPPSNMGLPTARCLILVTPDGERTMNTFLGASTELSSEDIDLETIASAQLTYLEGYLFDKPDAKEAFHAAARLARGAHRKVALSLSDAFCVDRHRADFLNLIREGVDVLFANETEITSLYQVNSFEEAVAASRGEAGIVVLTRSANGSVILSGRDTIELAAEPVAEVVDVTGAGDLYSAGFLFGLARGKTLEACGRLGGLAASEIIGHIGARPEVGLAALARQKGYLS
ncbi:MAG: adenosine kinase [Pseudomonadota bacterium]|nr:adenosine kinase [Pseudomonadota bacterium]